MERGLQELLSIFGLFIGPHVSFVVVASSRVASRYGGNWKDISINSHHVTVCDVTTYSANVFPSPNLGMNSF